MRDVIARQNANACTSRKVRVVIGSGLYFLVASFTVIGNPIAGRAARVIPIFGIILTLPWSLVAAAIHYSSVIQGTIALETCAALNPGLLFVLLWRKAQRSSAPKSMR